MERSEVTMIDGGLIIDESRSVTDPDSATGAMRSSRPEK